jgi:hypothetical protein
MPFQLVASQRKSGAPAHATSRTFSARKRQVFVPGARRVRAAAASASVTTATTPSLLPARAADAPARASRSRCAAVSTCSAFCSVPLPATTYPAGAVTL